MPSIQWYIILCYTEWKMSCVDHLETKTNAHTVTFDSFFLSTVFNYNEFWGDCLYKCDLTMRILCVIMDYRMPSDFNQNDQRLNQSIAIIVHKNIDFV